MPPKTDDGERVPSPRPEPPKRPLSSYFPSTFAASTGALRESEGPARENSNDGDTTTHTPPHNRRERPQTWMHLPPRKQSVSVPKAPHSASLRRPPQYSHTDRGTPSPLHSKAPRFLPGSSPSPSAKRDSRRSSSSAYLPGSPYNRQTGTPIEGDPNYTRPTKASEAKKQEKLQYTPGKPSPHLSRHSSWTTPKGDGSSYSRRGSRDDWGGSAHEPQGLGKFGAGSGDIYDPTTWDDQLREALENLTRENGRLSDELSQVEADKSELIRVLAREHREIEDLRKKLQDRELESAALKQEWERKERDLELAKRAVEATLEQVQQENDELVSAAEESQQNEVNAYGQALVKMREDLGAVDAGLEPASTDAPPLNPAALQEIEDQPPEFNQVRASLANISEKYDARCKKLEHLINAKNARPKHLDPDRNECLPDEDPLEEKDSYEKMYGDNATSYRALLGKYEKLNIYMKHYDGPEMKRQIEKLKQELLRKTDAYNEAIKKQSKLEQKATHWKEELDRKNQEFSQNTDALEQEKETLEREMRSYIEDYYSHLPSSGPDRDIIDDLREQLKKSALELSTRDEENRHLRNELEEAVKQFQKLRQRMEEGKSMHYVQHYSYEEPRVVRKPRYESAEERKMREQLIEQERRRFLEESRRERRKEELIRKAMRVRMDDHFPPLSRRYAEVEKKSSAERWYLQTFYEQASEEDRADIEKLGMLKF